MSAEPATAGKYGARPVIGLRREGARDRRDRQGRPRGRAGARLRGATTCARWCATRHAQRACCPPGVEAVRGDVTDPPSVAAAVAGCELVFNAMGIPEQWLADEAAFDRVNALGTKTVAEAARAAGVRRLVHTSTEDVFHAETGARFDETQVADYPKGTAYERSKQHAEELRARGARRARGRDRQPLRRVRARTLGHRLVRQEPVRAAGQEAAAGACRPAGSASCSSEGVARGQLLAADKGPRRRALHPLRPPRLAARARRDRRARRRTGPRAAHAAAPAGPRAWRRAARRSRA